MKPKTQSPVVKDVVLIGAGHAHVQVLKRFGMKPMPGVRLTLITREVHTPYSGMLPGLIAGLYDFDQAHIDTGPLCRFAGARLYQSAAIGIDLPSKMVICDNRPPVPYDILSINIGSTPNTASVAGAADHAVPVKPIDGFLARFEALRQRVLKARGERRIALVGGGAGGVELMLSLERRLRGDLAAAGHDPAAARFTLVSDPEVLPNFPESFVARFEAIFQERGIEIVTGSAVCRVERGLIHFQNGGSRAADEILWVTQAQPPSWLKATRLPLDEKGFLRVDAQLRAEGESDVFAAGDVIAFQPRPLPKSGVYAVRAGPVLTENIRRRLSGGQLTSFKPQREAMYLVSTGEPYAIGTRNGLVFAGEWVWRWKDRIDRRFMAKFNELPEMAEPEAAAASPVSDGRALAEIAAVPMRCGGCGAKVGATVLTRALGGIRPFARPEVLAGLNAADDAAVIDTGGEQLSVQTVDYFRAMVDDPYLFGRIAANHALGDIYAMGAVPQTALAIATLPYGIEAKVEADLAAMMAGANETLSAADCTLAGGHTSEGAELALGFAVTGLVPRDAVLRKDGARVGDRLILTKPLGTGTLFAADMRGKAKARWVMNAVAHMLQSGRAASEILVRHGAHAATDITGFGLIGHLVEMLKAGGVGARLDMGAIAALDGAAETLAAGIVSSLQPENLRLRRAIAEGGARDHPLFPLLFDPQTAGGLLAAVPAGQAEACRADLIAAGYDRAAIIGTVTEAPPGGKLVALGEAD
ncbi:MULTISPECIES: selenide, water dikinase SelD [Rhodomicrobium]|uniref:selenide, water dikinase SelD n=1 Tax=Rhodomicrobium TaxID=1068 RepID=UPI000B4A7D82|nr:MULTISPECIES: selenide, water dikinase SelD [Rhodomicrobium]